MADVSFRTDKPCSFCGRRGHTKMTCPDRPRKPLRSTTPLQAKSYMKRSTKPMRQESEKSKAKREAVSEEWYRLNGPGPWLCYLRVVPNCEKVVTRKTINLEHKLSKTRHPELKYVVTNLGPACSPCNEYKGSKDWIDGELV